MDLKSILGAVDHTNLKQDAGWNDIKKLCDEAMEYGTASVCIPPSFVKDAKEYMGEKMAVCTVIGFPNGYQTTAVKVFETEDAAANGADEIDMVVNIGWIKDRKYREIEAEITSIHKACKGKLLKVIIETCLLTREEKIELCHVVTRSGAEYIKTSTGFSTSGATFEDIRIFKEYVGSDVKIKAAGGIQTLDDAKEFIALGADRLGTSKIVALAKSIEL